MVLRFLHRKRTAFQISETKYSHSGSFCLGSAALVLRSSPRRLRSGSQCPFPASQLDQLRGGWSPLETVLLGS